MIIHDNKEIIYLENSKNNWRLNNKVSHNAAVDLHKRRKII